MCLAIDMKPNFWWCKRESPEIKIRMDVNFNDSMHLVVVNKRTHKQQSLLFCNIKPYNFTLLRESELSLPLINASWFKDLCQFVKVSETRGYFICLAGVIDPHLSFSVRKGHLNSTKKNFGSSFRNYLIWMDFFSITGLIIHCIISLTPGGSDRVVSVSDWQSGGPDRSLDSFWPTGSCICAPLR